MAVLKRDRVNRVRGYVYLPVDGSALYPGQAIVITRVKEAEIDCVIRDAMEMEEPVFGDAVGDAVFDAMPSVSYTELLGKGGVVLGFGNVLIGTGTTITDEVNVCDAQDYDNHYLVTHENKAFLTSGSKIIYAAVRSDVPPLEPDEIITPSTNGEHAPTRTVTVTRTVTRTVSVTTDTSTGPHTSSVRSTTTENISLEANTAGNIRIKDLDILKYDGYLPLDDSLGGTGKYDIGNMFDSVAPPFDLHAYYNENDYVMYNGRLYVFTAPKNPGPWDASVVRTSNAVEAISVVPTEMTASEVEALWNSTEPEHNSEV